MEDKAEKPIFGPESAKLDPRSLPKVTVRRSIVKAISWRTVGTIDTLILSYLLITFLGPIVGLDTSGDEAIEAAGLIAITEVATKMTFYFLHERMWAAIDWGIVVKAGRRDETYRRTTLKTVSWRTLASLDTIVLAWLYTGNIATAVSIGGLEVFTKMLLYFLHERVWARLPFGIVHMEAAGRAA